MKFRAVPMQLHFAYARDGGFSNCLKLQTSVQAFFYNAVYSIVIYDGAPATCGALSRWVAYVAVCSKQNEP